VVGAGRASTTISSAISDGFIVNTKCLYNLFIINRVCYLSAQKKGRHMKSLRGWVSLFNDLLIRPYPKAAAAPQYADEGFPTTRRQAGQAKVTLRSCVLSSFAVDRTETTRVSR